MSSSSKPLNPDVCEIPELPDISKYPDLSNPKNLTVENITPFLCEVIKLAKRDDVDPVLIPGPSAFDISPWIDSLVNLTDVGDPRLSLGELMKRTLDKYKPLLEVKLSILQDGCRIEDEIICDPSGKEVYNVKEVCGQGGFDINDINEEITLESLKKFTYDIWNEKLNKTAEDFSEFIKKNYLNKGWNVELISYSTGDLERIKYGREIPLFVVKVQNEKKEMKYFKYYFDSRNIVATKLNLKIQIKNVKDMRSSNDMDLVDALTGPFWPKIID
jgi:hypothetical protein